MHLRWQVEKGFQVEPIRGPVSSGKGAGPWIVEVRLTDHFRVRVRERTDGSFQLDTGRRGPGARPACGTRDVNEAIRYAEFWLEDDRDSVGLADEAIRAASASPHGITVGQVCDLLDETELVSKRTYVKYELACRVAKAVFGRDTPLRAINQRTLNLAIDRRMAGVPGLGLGPVGLRTAVKTLKDFATVISEVGHLQRPDHQSLVDVHPLRADRITWPKTKANKREPATREMFEILMAPITLVEGEEEKSLLAPVDRADPSGQLRLLLAIAYYTGRRFEAILQLRWEDVVRKLDDVRDLLHAAEHLNRGWAAYFPNGMLDFREEYDKEGNHFPVPISDSLELELNLYRSRLGSLPLSGPIFESPDRRGHPITQSCISKRPHRRRRRDGSLGRINLGRYDRALLIACRDLHHIGRDPADIFQVRRRRKQDDPTRLLEVDAELYRWEVLHGHKIHRWRSCYATQMAKLGYGRAHDPHGKREVDLDAHSSYIASWEPGDGSVKAKAYVHLDPRMLWAAVNFRPAWQVLREISEAEAGCYIVPTF